MILSLFYRYLYNHTLDTNPGAFNFLTAVVLALACIVNLYIFSQRWRMEQKDELGGDGHHKYEQLGPIEQATTKV